jgi:hypothetical protein
MITLRGEPFANYTWDGDTDIPTFEFLGSWVDFNKVQEARKPFEVECEQRMNRKPWTPEEDKPKRPELGWVKNSKGRWQFRIPWGQWKEETLHPLVETVGLVWQRKDKRWNWLQKPSDFSSSAWNKSAQGVADTEEAAKAMIRPSED